MAGVKDYHALTSYYVKRFKEVHKRDANVNRYAAQWGWKAMLEDMAADHVKKLVDFYLTTPSDRMHELDWFFYNYEKSERDIAATEKLLAESKQRAEEWRASGKRGITST
jgi:hypothetical protein